MSLTELFTHIAKLEQDPFVLYDKLEQAYRPNVFESVIFKKYSHLFDENSESRVKEQLEHLREETVNQLAKSQVHSATKMEHLHQQVIKVS